MGAATKQPLTTDPLAHLDEAGRPHLLYEHLCQVGDRAHAFAERFGAGEWARLAGRWHDLGKYARDFQRIIREENGFEAHLETEEEAGPRDHSTAGALHARQVLGTQAGSLLTLAIAGHHAGLANREKLEERLERRKELLQKVLATQPPPAILEATTPALPAFLARTPRTSKEAATIARSLELWTRMLFSALCDADFLDTEEFFEPSRTQLRAVLPPLSVLREKLARYMEDLRVRATPSEVNRVRTEVLASCLHAAAQPPGAFSLTVPTGGGKTLASLAFALEHAVRHGLERVVVAIPFTSIIEQSAAVYRAALGEEAVIEHHSALDPLRETARNRLASENWDAPVVVTTTAQLFDSLFARRPGACRKLHRLARSVVVLDEAQTLPPRLLTPILDVLGTLIRDYGTSLVVCTATQPALGRTSELPDGLENVREIVPAEVRAFERLRRVRVRWPTSPEPTSHEALADELALEPDVLAIVHRRADARELCEALDRRMEDTSTSHLSALMCPRHRSEVLAGLKARKARGEPIRLVSTQLVEAGVDVDFPVVYRALGGLDSLAQAAGRCNREGRLSGLGELRVFLAPTAPPRGVPRTAMEVTRGLLAETPGLDPFHPDICRRYFRRLYAAKELDAEDIQALRAKLRFEETARRFHLVEDGWSAPVVVPWGEAAKHVARLEHAGPSRERLRALQGFTVQVKATQRDVWLARGLVRWVADTVVVLGPELTPAYDERFGLMPERVGLLDAGSLVVSE
ncbi:CRISPR-associated endonuclease Cas3'' [Cystobacter ferrugineus]|uniref:CRISPR-associated endonuclease Cas3 n=2 Tax=Cystobacter ferrugineus TaxID=83449 RepID=A0A1L9B6Q4_9BACT|nr:CRISPR-associated endonuclease Cas3'' [Cystobacter ferrugineus]OJH37900.1 CRISPR-associated endonuclease Cas3'' [Cystobacter ferrugineus]